MHEDLKRRILDLLFMLHLREDGSLPMAAIALEREAGGPEFERDKSMLLQGGAISAGRYTAGDGRCRGCRGIRGHRRREADVAGCWLYLVEEA
jgi:hypothetical protein